MWRIFGKKEEFQPLSYSLASDETLMNDACRFSSDILESRNWEAAQRKGVDGHVRKSLMLEFAARCMRDETCLLAIVDEIRGRVEKDGMERHGAFAPLQQHISESYTGLSEKYDPMWDRLDTNDPVEREISARYLAQNIAQTATQAASPERPGARHPAPASPLLS
jgi:hypothetical protein